MENPDDLLTPSGDIVKYKQMDIGQVLQGTLVAVPQVLPDLDFKTKQQKVSKKGNPLWKFKLILEVGGENKTIYPEGSAYFDTLNAFKAAGIRRFQDAVGGTYAMRRDEDSPPQTEGFSPAKNFTVKFLAGE